MNWPRTIRVSLENVGPSMYAVSVKDEGTGVSSEDLVPREELKPGQSRSRGLALVNSLADLLETDGAGTIKAWFTISRVTQFQVERTGASWTIRPSGDISATVTDTFRMSLVDWFESGCQNLVLDLEHVEGIDSIGLSVLVSLSHMEGVRESRRTVRLVHLKPSLERLFRLTRLHVIFKT